MRYPNVPFVMKRTKALTFTKKYAVRKKSVKMAAIPLTAFPPKYPKAFARSHVKRTAR